LDEVIKLDDDLVVWDLTLIGSKLSIGLIEEAYHFAAEEALCFSGHRLCDLSRTCF
jgi:hypothetical protein